MSKRHRPLPKETQEVAIWFLDILETYLYDGRNPYERFMDDEGVPRFDYIEQETDDLKNALVGALRSYLDPDTVSASLDSYQRVMRVMGGSYKYSRWFPNLHAFTVEAPESTPVEDLLDNLEEVVLVSTKDAIPCDISKLKPQALSCKNGNQIEDPSNDNLQIQTGTSLETFELVERDEEMDPPTSPMQSTVSGITEPLTTIIFLSDQGEALIETFELECNDRMDIPIRPPESTISDITEPSTIASLTPSQTPSMIESTDLVLPNDTVGSPIQLSNSITSNITQCSTVISLSPTQKVSNVATPGCIERNNSLNTASQLPDSSIPRIPRPSPLVSSEEHVPDPSTNSAPIDELLATIPDGEPRSSATQSKKRQCLRQKQKHANISRTEKTPKDPVAVAIGTIPGHIGSMSSEMDI
jgi:hypothetical protein